MKEWVTGVTGNNIKMKFREEFQQGDTVSVNGRKGVITGTDPTGGIVSFGIPPNHEIRRFPFDQMKKESFKEALANNTTCPKCKDPNSFFVEERQDGVYGKCDKCGYSDFVPREEYEESFKEAMKPRPNRPPKPGMKWNQTASGGWDQVKQNKQVAQKPMAKVQPQKKAAPVQARPAAQAPQQKTPPTQAKPKVDSHYKVALNELDKLVKYNKGHIDFSPTFNSNDDNDLDYVAHIISKRRGIWGTDKQEQTAGEYVKKMIDYAEEKGIPIKDNKGKILNYDSVRQSVDKYYKSEVVEDKGNYSSKHISNNPVKLNKAIKLLGDKMKATGYDEQDNLLPDEGGWNDYQLDDISVLISDLKGKLGLSEEDEEYMNLDGLDAIYNYMKKGNLPGTQVGVKKSPEEKKAFWDRVAAIQKSPAMNKLKNDQGYSGDYVDYVAWGAAKDPETTKAVLAGTHILDREEEDEDIEEYEDDDYDESLHKMTFKEWAYGLTRNNVFKEGLGTNGIAQKGVPKTDEERKATHKVLYGDEELPPRGTGRAVAKDIATELKKEGLDKDVYEMFMSGKSISEITKKFNITPMQFFTCLSRKDSRDL